LADEPAQSVVLVLAVRIVIALEWLQLLVYRRWFLAYLCDLLVPLMLAVSLRRTDAESPESPNGDQYYDTEAAAEFANGFVLGRTFLRDLQAVQKSRPASIGLSVRTYSFKKRG
jgi:hypothetical protein